MRLSSPTARDAIIAPTAAGTGERGGDSEERRENGRRERTGARLAALTE